MAFLKLLEGIRCPALDAVMSVVTYLGDEIGFILVALIIYWCLDKSEGHYLMLVGFMGMAINQVLKITFRISRPWVKDPTLTVVGNAKDAATSYSFPSGHTQTSTGTFVTIARYNNRLWLYIVMVGMSLLVAFSRMYLGVHTPLDVTVSFFVAIALALALYPVIKWSKGSFKRLNILFLTCVGLALVAFIYIFAQSGEGTEFVANHVASKKNATTMLACIVGVYVAILLDTKYIHFDTKGSIPAHITKVVLGMGIMLAIKEGVKAIFKAIFGELTGGVLYTSTALRYFLMCLIAGALFPMTFKYINAFWDNIVAKVKEKRAAKTENR